jgi:hypothetical protein
VLGADGRVLGPVLVVVLVALGELEEVDIGRDVGPAGVNVVQIVVSALEDPREPAFQLGPPLGADQTGQRLQIALLDAPVGSSHPLVDGHTGRLEAGEGLTLTGAVDSNQVL